MRNRTNHDRIWLQNDHPESTWCAEKIHDDDVEYVNVSHVEAIKDAWENFDLTCTCKNNEDPCDVCYFQSVLDGGGA